MRPKGNLLSRRVENFREKRKRASDSKMVRVRTEHNGLSGLKTIFSLFIVFLQLGIILSLNFFFAIGLRWYLAFLFGVSVLTAISVLSSHRNAQAKAVWVIFILLFFPIGFVVYFMSDDRIMYRRPRKRHRAIYKKTVGYVKPYVEPQTSPDVLVNCRYLYHSCGYVPYQDTQLKYYSSASPMFDDVLKNLKKAQHFVFIEFFAISDGVLLERILGILEGKMKEGVDVRIIYDDMGSRALSRKTRKRIKKAGGQIRVFNKLLSKFSFALNYRDHRKIIVIDGKVAYTGGSNLADEYINEKRMYGYWKDTGLRLRGDAVDALTLTFLRQWQFIVKKQIKYDGFFGNYESYEGGGMVLPYAGGPEFAHPVCKSVYENVVSAAKQKLYIMTPYFVPDESVTQDIINAALAGVDVRIVLPSRPDKSYVYLVTKDNAERLTAYGVKVYYVDDAFVHSKVVLTEDCAIVGSVNFDMRSFYQQFENAVLSDDKKFMRDVERDFNNTFNDSILVEKQQKNGLLRSIIVSALRLVAPLM